MTDTSTDTATQPEKDEKKLAQSDSPELAALKAQKAILEEQAAMAESRKKIVSATLASEVKPLEGTVKIDADNPVESQILAYKSLNSVAQRIADKVAAKKPARVLIHADTDLSGLLGFQAFVRQLELIHTQLTGEKEAAEATLIDARQVAQGKIVAIAAPGLLMAPLVIGAAIRSSIDLLSLFRTDVSLKYKDLTIGDLALVASVSGHLLEKNIDIYYPSVMPPGMFSKDSDVLNRLKEMDKAREALDGVHRNVTDLKAELKQQIETLNTEITTAAAANPPQDVTSKKALRDRKQTALNELAASDARLTAAATAWTAFQSALIKADENSGLNALTRLIRAEKLATVAGADSHLLLLKVAAAGGGHKTKRNLFYSGKVFYGGGAIVEFILFEPSGKMAAAATLPAYSGLIELKEPECSSMVLVT